MLSQHVQDPYPSLSLSFSLIIFVVYIIFLSKCKQIINLKIEQNSQILTTVFKYNEVFLFLNILAMKGYKIIFNFQLNKIVRFINL